MLMCTLISGLSRWASRTMCIPPPVLPLPTSLFTLLGPIPLTFNQILQGNVAPVSTLRPLQRYAPSRPSPPCPQTPRSPWPPLSTHPPRRRVLASELLVLSSCPTPLHPRVYTPSRIPQARALTFDVHLHPALVLPNLQYDVRFPPTRSNPHLSLAILVTLATSCHWLL